MNQPRKNLGICRLSTLWTKRVAWTALHTFCRKSGVSRTTGVKIRVAETRKGNKPNWRSSLVNILWIREYFEVLKKLHVPFETLIISCFSVSCRLRRGKVMNRESRAPLSMRVEGSAMWRGSLGWVYMMVHLLGVVDDLAIVTGRGRGWHGTDN
jgi:hypothetical protein